MSQATATRPRGSEAGPPPPRHRRPRRGPLLLALLVVGAVAVWLVGWSSVLGVADVRVVGARQVEPERIVAAAAVEPGTPLARVDADAVRDRVLSVPRLAAVEVRRGWPRELVLVVTERDAVAVMPSPAGWALADASGQPFLDVGAPPRGLPRIAAEGALAADAAAVAAGLPPDLRRTVERIEARTLDDIRLTLRSGPEVAWGSAEQTDLKARILVALLPLQARAYDVSAPELPTSTGASRPRGNEAGSGIGVEPVAGLAGG